jgi:sugar lactone lactonase YvrE
VSAIEIRCLVNPGCSLGEGPVWDAASRRLYWVDILEKRVYRHDPAAGRTEFWTTPEQVGFVLPGADGSLVAGFQTGLHHLTLRLDRTVTASRIDRIDDDRDDVRFNDATRDSEGRIWACTLGGSPEQPRGAYYRYDTELNRQAVDENYLVANGPALSPDGRLIYTVETSGHPSRPKGVYVARVTPSGRVAQQRLLIAWDAHASSPDGVVTDRDGNLWLGEFHGNVLRRFSAAGEQTAAIPLPAWNVTKPAFGGERRDLLYVTSARYGVDAETLARYPDTGGVVEIAGVGAAG